MSKVKGQLGDIIADKMTAGMATWTFVFVFLALCILEIIGNHSGVFHFDPQTIILNLILSLIAAIQGSIIMIAQKKSDAKLRSIIELMESQELEEIEKEDEILKNQQLIISMLKGLPNAKD